jgi:hypothetical protein
MVIDLSKFMRAKNRIAKIGIEMEGGWITRPDLTKIHADGSVNVGSGDYIHPLPYGMPRPSVQYTGEVSSAPMDVKLDHWREWMLSCHPVFINKSCGLHVHMSFNVGSRYVTLMHKNYQDTLLEAITRWAEKEMIPSSHPLWSRLRGRNQYCTLDFWPDLQAIKADKGYGSSGTPGSRYTAVNYPAKLHGTIEVRVLPMFMPELSVKAVEVILETTNAYLLAVKPQQKNVTTGWKLRYSTINEVYRTCV